MGNFLVVPLLHSVNDMTDFYENRSPLVLSRKSSYVKFVLEQAMKD